MDRKRLLASLLVSMSLTLLLSAASVERVEARACCQQCEGIDAACGQLCQQACGGDTTCLNECGMDCQGWTVGCWSACIYCTGGGGGTSYQCWGNYESCGVGCTYWYNLVNCMPY